MVATRENAKLRVHVVVAAAIVLALVAFLTPVSGRLATQALAAEGEQTIEKVNVATEAELVEATIAWRSDEATIVLTSNIVLTSPLTIRDGMNVKIDLKGRTLSRDLEDFEKDGHVILIEQFGTLNIVDTSAKGSGRISGGRAQNGGGIYNRGTLNLTGGTVCDCKAKECGGGIHNSGTMTVTSTWIERCEAVGGGGVYNRGIAAVGAKNIQDNAATEIGGGILNDGSMTLTRCTVRRNSAHTAGGIASRIVSYTDETTLDVSGCTITANTATYAAGGLYGTRIAWDVATEAKGKEHKGTVTLGGASKITNNSSPTVGGVLCDLGHSLVLKGVTVTGNTTGQGGVVSGTPIAGGVSFNGKANMADKSPTGTFSIEGKNIIKNNKCAGVTSDTTICSYDKIQVTEKIETGTQIGITPSEGPIQEFTHDYGEFMEELPDKFFFTPAVRSIKLKHGEARLIEPVPYVNADGDDAVTDDYDLAENATGDTWYGGDYVAYRDETMKQRVTCHGGVNLILRDGVSLEFPKGIELPNDNGTWTSLRVFAQSEGTGSLTAEGRSGEPGIGARGSTYGRFVLHGGNVLAIGGNGGAGIGGGDMRPGTNSLEVEICGGTLTARGGRASAGIGCGAAGNIHGCVTIRGGDVSAVGKGGGAGIGGAAHASTYVDARILGGTTLAASEYKGADAVGYGLGDEGFAEVEVGEGMTVLADGNVDAYKRVSTCMSSTYVIINPCTHKATDMEYIDDKTHEAWCRYCGANRRTEPHRLYDHECACGYRTPTYTITYDPAGGRGETYVGESAYEGETLTLQDYTIWVPNGLPPSGKWFFAWEVAGEFLQPGDTVTMNGDVTARAVWSQACRVTFKPGEGRGKMNNVICAKGSALTLPECTLEGPSGKGFAGWKMGDRLYAAGDAVEVTGNLDFVAQWGMNWAMLQEAIDAADNGDTIVLPNDVRAADSDKALAVGVGKSVTIDLAGHAIDRGLKVPTTDGYCIYVAGTLNIIDTSEGQTGLITGANNANRRRARAHDLVGGGLVIDEGTVTLAGGTVAGNEAGDGAGVQLVCAGSSFRMSGGSVSNNTAHGAGGGVYVAYRSTFAMSGGAITDNAIPASEDVAEGEEGAGIYAYDSIELQGAVTIAGNTSAGGRANNIYLAYRNARIRVTGTLEPTTPIGVITKRPDPVSYITEGLTSNGHLTDFVADDPSQVVAPDGDEAVMRRPLMLTFDAGGEEVEGKMEPAPMAYGAEFTLPAAGFVSIAHRVFRAWSIGGVEYAAGVTYLPRSSVTAYALWDDTYEVSFDAGAGSGTVESAYVACGDMYNLPDECPFDAPRGCSFAGWVVDGASYAPGAQVRVDGPLTATAIWEMDWSGLQEILDQGGDIEVTLPHDIRASAMDGPLTIRDEDQFVTIDLAGHSIDRALGGVLSAESEAESTLRAAAGDAADGAVFDLVAGFSNLTLCDSVGGGTVTGARGAAVFRGGRGTEVYLEDVCVSGNEVTDGVFDAAGRLSLTRSTITGNRGTTCGGVHVKDFDFIVDAGSAITGNTCQGRPSNVRLAEGARISVEGLLPVDEPIGVSCDVSPLSGRPVPLTSGLFGYGDEGSFVSEQEGCLVTIGEDDEAYLVVPATVTIKANGGVGSMEVEPLPEGIHYPLPPCTIKPPAGKAFDAWLVAWGDGREPTRSDPDERVTLVGGLTLTALWVDHEHVLVEVPAKDPSCTEDGWDAHWACAVTDKPCGRIFADGKGSVEIEPADVARHATGHQGAPAVEENVVEATEDTPASFDSVTYCAVCGTELSRIHVIDDKLSPPVPVEHVCVAGDPVEEGRVEPTCDEIGSVHVVIYCKVCGREMDRSVTFFDALGHDWAEPTFQWADDLSSVTARHVCSRDASHVETETAKTETREVPVDGGTQKLVRYTAVFENPDFGIVSRERLIRGEGGNHTDDGDGHDKDDESSAPSRETHPSTPTSTHGPVSAPVYPLILPVPLGTRGGALSAPFGIERPAGYTRSSDGSAWTGGSTGTNVQDGTSGQTTPATSSTTPLGSIAAIPSANSTTGTQSGTETMAGTDAAMVTQAPAAPLSNAVTTRQVGATQVTGAGEAGGDSAGPRASAALAATSDATGAPVPVVLAGVFAVVLAIIDRVCRQRREPRL